MTTRPAPKARKSTARKPARPAVFEVPAEPGSNERFEFTLPGDKTIYRLPLVQHINADLLNRLVENESIRGDADKKEEHGLTMLQLQRELFEEYLPEGFMRKVSTAQAGAIFNAWSGASTVSAGESSSS